MDRLMTLVYDELRAVARRQLRRWRPGQTLDSAARGASRFLQPFSPLSPNPKSAGTHSQQPDSLDRHDSLSGLKGRWVCLTNPWRLFCRRRDERAFPAFFDPD